MALDLRGYKKLVIAGVELKKLAIDGVEVWRSGYTNQVPLSINADGSIYNDGLGYKNGYRVRSGGAEGGHSLGACTGFIKVNAGDVIRIAGWEFEGAASGNSINASDSSFTNLGQAASNGAYGIFAGAYSAYNYDSVVKERENVYRWVVPPAASGVVYIRISGYTSDGLKGDEMIVTINEEIE